MPVPLTHVSPTSQAFFSEDNARTAPEPSLEMPAIAVKMWMELSSACSDLRTLRGISTWGPDAGAGACLGHVPLPSERKDNTEGKRTDLKDTQTHVGP